MNHSRSLKHLLLGALAAFTLTATLVVIGIVALFGNLRQDVQRDYEARLSEDRAANDIVMAVYGQLLAANRQIQQPDDEHIARFTSLGAITHDRVRQYLFQEMSLDARLQVEAIKELLQSMEVDAHQAFDLAARGELDAAQDRVAELAIRAAALEREMDGLVALRTAEHRQAQVANAGVYDRLLVGILLVVVFLIIGALVFVRMIQRRVVHPLTDLAHGAMRIGRGELTTRIPLQRHAELELVARSFNDMATSVQNAQQVIELRNASLTDAVRDLSATQQELVQQEKLGAIGFMLAGLAHELNNPLAGILGTAQILESELSGHSDPRVRGLATELAIPLVTESRRAGDLVKNLLQFSRKSGTKVAVVNLKAALDVAAGLRGYAFTQAGKVLQIEVTDDLFVALEEQRFEHVALNIMSNALEALQSHGGTRLLITADRSGPDGVVVTFEDDGPGFEAPDRVFDAFYTTKSVGAGTGLGLTLVHQFLTEAGASIAASNSPLGGARLTVRLPLAAAPISVPGKAHPATPSSRVDLESRTDWKVLVVDDEPALRSIQRRFLEPIGCEVYLACNGAEAITLLETTAFDAVVTDVRMPGEIDGMALHAWIRDAQPHLADRCLFVTGDIGAWDPESGLPLDAARVLTKPFIREEYVARVKQILAAELVVR